MLASSRRFFALFLLFVCAGLRFCIYALELEFFFSMRYSHTSSPFFYLMPISTSIKIGTPTPRTPPGPSVLHVIDSVKLRRGGLAWPRKGETERNNEGAQRVATVAVAGNARLFCWGGKARRPNRRVQASLCKQVGIHCDFFCESIARKRSGAKI